MDTQIVFLIYFSLFSAKEIQNICTFCGTFSCTVVELCMIKEIHFIVGGDDKAESIVIMYDFFLLIDALFLYFFWTFLI